MIRVDWFETQGGKIHYAAICMLLRVAFAWVPLGAMRYFMPIPSYHNHRIFNQIIRCLSLRLLLFTCLTSNLRSVNSTLDNQSMAPFTGKYCMYPNHPQETF